MNLVIVVDDFSPEPLSEGLRTRSAATTVVTVSDIISDFGFRFSGETGLMSRDKDTTPAYLSQNGCLLLDRVVEISTKTAFAVSEETGLISCGQLSSCYRDILARVARPFRTAMDYSTTGKLQPLFTQWTTLGVHLPKVRTPSFVYGYGPEIIDTTALSNPVRKSPFNLYEWKNDEVMSEEVWDTFCVDVPVGRPAVSYFMGESITSAFLDAEPTTSGPAFPDAIALTARIKDAFGAAVGEVLWFVNGDDVTFAAFSHNLYAASKLKSFPGMCDALLAELSLTAVRLPSLCDA